MAQIRLTQNPPARQCNISPPLMPCPAAVPAVVPTVVPANTGRLQPRLRRRFEHLIPKRSIRFDCDHTNLTGRRSVLSPYPRDSKLFLLVEAGERNFAAQLKPTVDAIQQRSAPANIDRHRSLIQRTTADVGPGKQHRQRQIDPRVAALAEPLRSQVVQELLDGQRRPLTNQIEERVGRFVSERSASCRTRHCVLTFLPALLPAYENSRNLAIAHQPGDQFL